MNQPASLPARLQALYESFSTERERALDRLDELFTADVRFKDPFRETRGIADFRELFERMFRQYKSVGFEHFRIVGTEDAFTLTYDMRLRMVVGPDFTTSMASVCVARGGKVAELVDYYDFASSLVSPVRAAAFAYRWITNRLFL